MMADLKEGRAHMIRPKYQLPTEASETPHDVGPDEAAECERSNGIAFENWTFPLNILREDRRTNDGWFE